MKKLILLLMIMGLSITTHSQTKPKSVTQLVWDMDTIDKKELRAFILKYGRPVSPSRFKRPTISVINCTKCFKRHMKHHARLKRVIKNNE